MTERTEINFIAALFLKFSPNSIYAFLPIDMEAAFPIIQLPLKTTVPPWFSHAMPLLGYCNVLQKPIRIMPK